METKRLMQGKEGLGLMRSWLNSKEPTVPQKALARKVADKAVKGLAERLGKK